MGEFSTWSIFRPRSFKGVCANIGIIVISSDIVFLGTEEKQISLFFPVIAYFYFTLIVVCVQPQRSHRRHKHVGPFAQIISV